MNFLKSIFENKPEFKPDYRDTILYNGQIEFRASGVFSGDLLEFIETNNTANKILFNPNLKKQAYIENHNNYDLVRNKDRKNFSTFGMTMSQGTFIPTGRIFKNQAGLDIVWEFMLKDNPQTVMFFKLPLNENFITGRDCK